MTRKEEVLAELIRLIIRRGGSEEDLYRLNTLGGRSTMEEVASIIVEASKQARSIWKTIMVGGATTQQLFIKLADDGRDTSSWARGLMSRPEFVTSKNAKKVSFTRKMVKELGFTGATNTTKLLECIKESGGLCQPEDAAWLVLEDQPCDDVFWVATNPIIDSKGNPKIFCVRRCRDGKKYLRARRATPDAQWYPDAALVFRSTK